MYDDDKSPAAPELLEFGADRGASRSFWIAAFLTLLIVGWMGSGFIVPSDAVEAPVQRTEPQPVAVSVQTSTAELVTLYFQAEGQALPDRDTAIRTEASGQIAEVLVTKGEDVADGATIARFGTSESLADLTSARAELERAQRELDNASALLQRGIATADRVAQARATFAAAEARVSSAEEVLESTTIVAPFAGRVETLDLAQGEYIAAGTDVGRIVDNTPLTIAVQVPQQSLRRLQNGQPARVRFITGEERTGTVSFVGTSAARETRTFLAEVDVPNADGAIPAGVSAEIRIPTGEVEAHFLSPSIVSLNPEGALGVKAVDADDVVRFYPIEIVRAQIDGIWVTGLPETAQIVTVGQGYVNDGETVRPQPEATGDTATSVAAESK